MASNILHLGQERKGSDATSEISETGTSTSTGTGTISNWESREDLLNYMARMGFKDITDLYHERFKVDRKKLEQMLSGDTDAPLPADVFFEQIMADTDTFITWPSKLKIGAKSKKDPHVRVAGKPKDVTIARERIMTVLDTRSNRVTMKMDVSYTDHSHIIGKGGLSIKRVMQETQCHVHFPDSNRSNATEKSNQVSIAGDIQGVELARSRVRQKIPVVFGFELPIMSQSIDPNSPHILKIQEQYNVQVILRMRPKLHAILVLVKGVEWEVEQVKKATMLLVEHLCDHLANQTLIVMSMEISPHHHPVVIGKNHSNLKDIIRATGAQIMFPDANDPNIPSLKKSNVTITGNIHNVYAAKQLLTGSLPLLLMFDLPEDTTGLPIKPENTADIQLKYNVSINIRLKAKQNNFACVIKGIERSASNIYKARNVILGIDESSVIADIPASYHLPNVPQNLQTAETMPQAPIAQPPAPPILGPVITPSWHYPPSGANSQTGSVMTHLSMLNSLHSGQSSGYQSLSPIARSNAESRENSSYSPLSSGGSSLPCSSSPNHHYNYHQRNYQEQAYQEYAQERSGYQGGGGERRREKASAAGNIFDNTRMAGIKAMQTRPTGSEVRYPTSVWSGYGLSKTCPPELTAEHINDEEEDFRHELALDNSNYLEHASNDMINSISSTKWRDIMTLLTSLGLEKYMQLFSTQEIDLSTFSAMTHKELLEIGVTAFGARKKMLLAIAELKKQKNSFCPAPGAERKNRTQSPREQW